MLADYCWTMDIEYTSDGMIILSWIFRQWNGESWTGLVWLRIGQVAEFLSEVMNIRIP